jgi:type II secretory pathway pseudopilin PulG
MRKAIPLVITVIVLGLLASIAVPNLITARQRSLQKRTMADLRSIATAWEARATKVNSYSVDASGQRVSLDDLERALAPTYIRTFPRRDGWGYKFEIQSTPQFYALRSLGSDGRSDGLPYIGATTSFSQDLVFANGSFTQYPEGA